MKVKIETESVVIEYLIQEVEKIMNPTVEYKEDVAAMQSEVIKNNKKHSEKIYIVLQAFKNNIAVDIHNI